jgi:sialate O-acetylesterase
VKLPPFISSHMVLQRGMNVPVWGTAAPGEKVTVTFRDQEKSATADAGGRWRVKLDPLAPGPAASLTVAGRNTLTLTDVLVGDVWVGAGQSNMAKPAGVFVKTDPDLSRIVEQAHPDIRLASATTPWVPAEPKTSVRFSALMLAFGAKLHDDQKVPVGLFVGAMGSTATRTWLSEAMLEADPASKALRDETPAGGNGKPDKPNAVPTTGSLYGTMIEPFVGFAIRGVLWDQGEEGTGFPRMDAYTLTSALFKGWRKAWGQGDFPFLYVQKPSGGGCAWDYCLDPKTQAQGGLAPLPAAVPRTEGGDMTIRESYVRLLDVPHTAMVISSDLGGGLHPIDKSRYGARAALVAQGVVYGGPVEYYGPHYASHAVEGDKLRIRFTHVGKGLTFRNGDKLQGFAVAGENRKWAWADARIDGDSIVVSSPQVPKPVAVSYAWARSFPWANLFNKDGLPAISFLAAPWEAASD